MFICIIPLSSFHLDEFRSMLVRGGCVLPMIALLSSTEFYIELTAARALAELTLDGSS